MKGQTGVVEAFGSCAGLCNRWNGENMNDKFVAGLNGCCACNLRGLLKDV